MWGRVKVSFGGLMTLRQVYPVISKGVWLLRDAFWKVFPRFLSLTDQLGSQVQSLLSTWFLSLTWMAPMWIPSLHHARLLSLLHLEDHFCFGNWIPCSWETTQNWEQGARDKQLPHNSGLPSWVSGPVKDDKQSLEQKDPSPPFGR